MKATQYAGIDYSLGRSNRNESGFCFGVISQNSVASWIFDYQEFDFGTPQEAIACPECGKEYTAKAWGETISCECGESFDADLRDFAEPVGWSAEFDGYRLCDCLQNDIFVLQSPYFTHAQFCSRCVPGAGNLDSPCESGPKTLCLGHDFFESGVAPYPVFSVDTGELVLAHNA